MEMWDTAATPTPRAAATRLFQIKTAGYSSSAAPDFSTQDKAQCFDKPS